MQQHRDPHNTQMDVKMCDKHKIQRIHSQITCTFCQTVCNLSIGTRVHICSLLHKSMFGELICILTSFFSMCAQRLFATICQCKFYYGEYADIAHLHLNEKQMLWIHFCSCLRAYTHTHTHTHTHAHMHTMYTWADTHSHSSHMCMHIHIYIYTHSLLCCCLLYIQQDMETKR